MMDELWFAKIQFRLGLWFRGLGKLLYQAGHRLEHTAWLKENKTRRIQRRK